MWIMTQDRKTILNSEQIISLFVEYHTKTIKARVRNGNGDGYIHTLGVYGSDDDVDKVFSKLYLEMSDGETLGTRMPLGGEVNEAV